MSQTLADQADRIARAFAPAYVVVDELDKVILFSGGTGRFLDPAGATTLHLPSLVPAGIVAELQDLMRWTRSSGQPSKADGLVVQTASNVSRWTVAVTQLAEPDSPDRLMVLFRNADPEPGVAPTNRHLRDVELANDLRVTQDRLQSVSEKLAFSNEEFQTATEELEATNEELGATGEELQASNEALTARVAELDQVNSDTRNMLRSTQIAIVFLDKALRIRSFTPAIHGFFPLIQQDVGRPLADIVVQVVYPELVADARHVLDTQAMMQREVDAVAGGQRYLARIVPYRDSNGHGAGVVLAFIDVTVAHRADQAFRDSQERLHRMAASVPALLFISDDTPEWSYVNPPFYTFTGMPAGAALGLGWLAALHPDDQADARTAWLGMYETTDVLEHEIRFRRDDGAWRWFLLRAVPQRDGGGRVVRWFGSCTDIDDRRRAEARQGRMLADLQHRVKNILAVVRSLLTRTLASSTSLDHFGRHFGGRIDALGRSQSAAARTPEHLVMLDELVIEELAAQGAEVGGQSHVDGPEVALPQKIAGVMGLALHELSTNAVKYGALSVSSGQVDVLWTVEQVAGSSHLTLDWRESGVPVTDLSPSRRGFGRELIEQGLSYELGATATLHFRPGGLHCRISLPLDRSIAQSRTAT